MTALQIDPATLGQVYDSLWVALASGARAIDRYQVLGVLRHVARLHVAAGPDGDTTRSAAGCREIREIAAAQTSTMEQLAHAVDRPSAIALLHACAMGHSRRPRLSRSPR